MALFRKKGRGGADGIYGWGFRCKNFPPEMWNWLKARMNPRDGYDATARQVFIACWRLVRELPEKDIVEEIERVKRDHPKSQG